MLYRGHIVGGLAFGYISQNIDYFKVDTSDSKVLVVGFAGLVIGSLIPDIDHRGSYISKKLKLTSKLGSKFLSHRGFTHSILGMGLMTFMVYGLSRFLNLGFLFEEVFTKAIFVGIFSHLFLDMLTPAGISLLSPLSRRRFKLTTGYIKDYSKLSKREKLAISILVIIAFIAYMFEFFGGRV